MHMSGTLTVSPFPKLATYPHGALSCFVSQCAESLSMPMSNTLPLHPFRTSLFLP